MEITLEGLEERARAHDWYYQMSDDHNVWAAGNQSASELNYFRQVLEARGEGDAAEKILAKYRRKMPTLEEMLKPHPIYGKKENA